MGLKGKPATVTRYLTQYRPGHPTEHADGRVRIHRAVLYDKIGPGWHPCNWCGRPVSWDVKRGKDQLVSDHVDNDTWNNDQDNLVPACNRCNLHRHLTLRPTCINNHPWTVENTYLRPDGKPGRMCRTCSAISEAKRPPRRR